MPGRHFELITFKIRPSNALIVVVIYEALAHRCAAIRSYALVYIPEEQQEEQFDLVEEVASEASCHGIDIILAEVTRRILIHGTNWLGHIVTNQIRYV